MDKEAKTSYVLRKFWKEKLLVVKGKTDLLDEIRRYLVFAEPWPIHPEGAR